MIVCPEAPYPLYGGGAIRTASMLHYLAQRYPLDAILFRERGSPDPRAALPPGLIQENLLIDLPYHRRGGLARVWRNLKRLRRDVPPLVDRFAGYEAAIERFCKGHRWNVVVLEHFWTAPYRTLLGEFSDSTVLNLHNVESRLHELSAQVEPGPVGAGHRRFAAACRRLEAEFLPQFDIVLTASDEDRELARRISSQAIAHVYPNAIPEREAPCVTVKNQIVFTGNLAYHPNQAAVGWFASSIWPLLCERYPGLEWVLAGKNPEAVRKYVRSSPGVRLTGEIPDTWTELAGSSAAIVPLRSGSGTRIKILEAWGAGAPVVSTAIGAQGLAAEHGKHLLLADNVQDFADAVGSLLDSPKLRGSLIEQGRSLLAEKFTWAAGWKALDRLGI
ncbi:MAG: glycosyltransferase [Acidimicrobiia bacterium]|nr:glycosyltransferase [Acidimicrobiia bacterium]